MLFHAGMGLPQKPPSPPVLTPVEGGTAGQYLYEPVTLPPTDSDALGSGEESQNLLHTSFIFEVDHILTAKYSLLVRKTLSNTFQLLTKVDLILCEFSFESPV